MMYWRNDTDGERRDSDPAWSRKFWARALAVPLGENLRLSPRRAGKLGRARARGLAREFGASRPRCVGRRGVDRAQSRLFVGGAFCAIQAEQRVGRFLGLARRCRLAPLYSG